MSSQKGVYFAFMYFWDKTQNEDHCLSELTNRNGFEGVFMDGRSSVDVTQSECDLPDFNQSEH